MPVPFEALPAAVRAQVRARGVTMPPAPARRPRAHTSGVGGSWRCHACQEPFERYAPAERHAHDTGHCRLEVVL